MSSFKQMSLQKIRRYNLTHNTPPVCLVPSHQHDSEMVITFKGKSFCQVTVASLHCLFDYWVYWKYFYCHTTCLSFTHCFLLISPYPALNNWFIFVLELIFFFFHTCMFILLPQPLSIHTSKSWGFLGLLPIVLNNIYFKIVYN